MLVKLNAEQEGSQAAARFGVSAYPTLLFLNSSGREVGRIPGYVGAEDFLHELQGILGQV